MNILDVALVAGSFCLAAFATRRVRAYALRHDMLDVPNARSSHLAPTPRGGGVAIVGTFFAGVLLLTWLGRLDPRLAGAVLSGAAATAAVGYLDDRWHMPARARFAVHLVAAIGTLLLLQAVPRILPASFGAATLTLEVLLTLLGLVWCTNLFNFMDGIDGIAAAEAAFLSAAGALMNSSAGGEPGLTAAFGCLCAASLGFLRWNWPPARIFMGDAGSGFLGFTLGALAVATLLRQPSLLPAWLILWGVFLVDATVTLLRRVARGDRWFDAHRLHAYQHSARRFGSHRTVTLACLLLNVLWLLPWACLAVFRRELASLAAGLALLPLLVAAWFLGSGRLEA